LDKNGDGYTLIPKDIKQRYKKDGINILYSAGYLFSKYDGKSLVRNLQQSTKYWDGYWLFNLQQLWKSKDELANYPKLKDSVENLEEAVVISNTRNY
jgi:hypothetical protein